MKFEDFIKMFPTREYQNIHCLTDWGVNEHFDSIDESFNRPASVKIMKQSSDYFETEFVIKDIKYRFIARFYDKSATIIFHPLDGETDLFKQRKDDMYVGTVFASIFKSLKKMIQHNPHIIEIAFIADYPKLEDLYQLMNPTILKRFPEWELYKKFKNKQGKMQYSYVKKGE